MSNYKQEHNKFLDCLNIRIPRQITKLIKAKALEHNTSTSELIRQSIMQYINRNLNDSEILHASMVETKNKIGYLEKKIEVLAIIITEQLKYLMQVMPEKKGSEYSIFTEKNYKDFMQNCETSLKANHNGILESMILDFYEQGKD